MLKKIKFKLPTILSISAIILTSIAITYKIMNREKGQTITIYHTNDMHGCLTSSYSPDGKLLQIGADVLISIKKNTKDCMLLDAGDCTQGTNWTSDSHGEKMIELMNAVGYDIMTLGNHEFDYGKEALRINSELANFPMISANTLDENGIPFLQSETNNGCNMIKEICGKKIGFFGITTSETPYSTHPDNTKGVIFKDEVQTSKQQVDYLKQQGADIIVAIMHLGNSDKNVSSEQVALEVPGIDVIIDGHSHEVYSKTVGHTLIQQTGTKAQRLGKIEIAFCSDGRFSIQPQIIKASDLIDPMNPDAMQYTPDPQVRALSDKTVSNIPDSFKTVIGKTDSGLYGGEYSKTRICRLQDTNLGLLMGDALLLRAKDYLSEVGPKDNFEIVSLQNGGGIRSSISPGFVSSGDIMNVFPFPNKVSISQVSPRDLYQILENGVKSIHLENGLLTGADGAFPNVGGMRFEYDITKAPMIFNDEKDKIISEGSRIVKIILLNEDGTDKKVLDRNDTKSNIAFVSNTFQCCGGDHYIMLKNLKSLTNDGDPLGIVLSDYIKRLTFDNNGGFKYPVNLSRAKLIGSETLFNRSDVTVTIRENSAIFRDGNVTMQIDGGQPFKSKTDSEGNIILKDLEQGPHDIKVSKKGFHMNAYINNRIGITHADIFLENVSKRNVDNVTNIISGISRQEKSDINKYVHFARSAYESLSEKEKLLVTNYENLVKAERNMNILIPSAVQGLGNFPTTSKRHTIITIIILVGSMWILFMFIRNKSTSRYINLFRFKTKYNN